MTKQELTRLKTAFLPKNKGKKELPSPKSPPQLNIGMLVGISFSVVLATLIISHLTRSNKNPLKATKTSLAMQANFAQGEIESLILIEGKNNLKPILKEFPITITSASLKTLVVNLQNPLNIYENNVRIYFENEPKQIGVVLKDYLYSSNSQEPVKVDLKGESYLEINSQKMDFNKYNLNLYRISQFRLLFEPDPANPSLKIKAIEIVRK